MTKVMFLCTGNSCRSQMAEGFAKHYGKGQLEVYSAGVAPAGVSPYAVRVMAELGIDISMQSSDPIDPELLGRMDVVITLCGHAEAICPATPPHIKRLHWPVEDPASTIGNEEAILAANRGARDEIAARVKEFIEGL